MQRRQVLVSLGSLAFLSGCLGGPAGSLTKATTMTGTNTSESESTEPGRAATTANDCGRTEFCEGSELIRVRVDSGFSSKVVLNSTCHESDIGLLPSETKTLIRRTDTETYDVEFLVNGGMAYNGWIQDCEYVMVRVGSDGEISLQREVL